MIGTPPTEAPKPRGIRPKVPGRVLTVIILMRKSGFPVSVVRFMRQRAAVARTYGSRCRWCG
jgi:hypothetical protein